MGIKASEVSDWVRQRAGKRDYREVLSDDVVVIRPGPNFDWFMGSLTAGQPAPPAPEQSKSSDDRREAGDRLGEALLPSAHARAHFPGHHRHSRQADRPRHGRVRAVPDLFESRATGCA